MSYSHGTCGNCGEYGHRRAECPQALCECCGQAGHWVHQCKIEAAAKCCVACSVRQHKAADCWVLESWVRARIREPDCSLLVNFVLRRAAETADGFCVLCFQNEHSAEKCPQNASLGPLYAQICGSRRNSAVLREWVRSQQQSAVCACARVDFLRRAGESRSLCFICFENGHEKKNCSRHQLRLQFEQIRALFGNLQRRTNAKTTTDSAASPFWASWSGRRSDDIRRHRYMSIGKDNRGNTKKQAAAEDDLGQNAAETRGPQNICQRREWRRESAQRRLGDRSAAGCSKW
ncbi:hypothetical protein niasHT_012064 [Heterodera trifolii]|uniref:CCHC-type domain-containing protein n=1 Tax=Heterodera trifolii TaxID=157864 RepID=A0ABD2LA36_9BILA